ncbi:MAG: IS3 family transposase, partial [Armatimonadetes bacterium]|nr:IS3 family transposase [Armatimonadota bacterium]NIT32318.1 IS3 family transposase [Armatimonadota bacterium]
MKGIPQGRYTKEFRQEAVKLVTEEGLSWAEAARRLSLPTSTLANWVKAYKAGKLGDVGKTYRPLTEVEMELARTKKELAEVKMERDILKKAAAYFGQGVAARYASMKELRLDYPLALVRRVLSVSASGYYSWLDRPLSKWAREEIRLEVEIKAAHKRTRQTYGPERLQYDLAEHGVRVGICRIKRIRRKLGIRCKQKRKFKATTDSKHTFPVAENLLGQQFEVSEPNKVWTSDITYVPTDEGWLYVAGHKDLFTGNIVGYAMGARMTRNLVSDSLFRAIEAKRPGRGLTHHSDRGSQYCACEYRDILDRFGLKVSMSGKGNCYDNAPMESFWGTLKQELVHHRRYRTRLEAMRDITEYIEIFYNRQRRQARLGFL